MQCVKKLFGLRSMIVCFVMFATTGFSYAIEYSIAPITIQLEESWTFIPIMGDDSVESYVGLRNTEVIGDNMTVVWYRRAVDQSWESWAWDEQDQSKAFASIKDILGLPDSSDGDCRITSVTSGSTGVSLLCAQSA